MSSRYNKDVVEDEAIKSVETGRITEILGVFIMDRATEIAYAVFRLPDPRAPLIQALIDNSVMRVCEEFIERYEEGKCAANLIIGMIYSSMYNTMKATRWKDDYGQNTKQFVGVVTEDGELKRVLIKSSYDENISKGL